MRYRSPLGVVYCSPSRSGRSSTAPGCAGCVASSCKAAPSSRLLLWALSSLPAGPTSCRTPKSMSAPTTTPPVAGLSSACRGTVHLRCAAAMSLQTVHNPLQADSDLEPQARSYIGMQPNFKRPEGSELRDCRTPGFTPNPCCMAVVCRRARPPVASHFVAGAGIAQARAVGGEGCGGTCKSPASPPSLLNAERSSAQYRLTEAQQKAVKSPQTQ